MIGAIIGDIIGSRYEFGIRLSSKDLVVHLQRRVLKQKVLRLMVRIRGLG